MSTQNALSLVTIVMIFGGFMQAKRHNAAAMQAGMLSVAQPPLEAAPTPQGYAQRHSIGHVPVPVQNQGQGSSDGAGQQGHGQGQQMMDSSRPRNADGDQGGDDMGGSAEQQPITLSQVRCRKLPYLLELFTLSPTGWRRGCGHRIARCKTQFRLLLRAPVYSAWI